MTAFFVCTAVLGPSIPIAHAGQMDLEKAASHIAAKIARKGRTRVIVADFLGPKDQVTELGRELADEFSVALANANPGLNVFPRTGRAVTVETQFGESMERREGSAARELGRSAGAEVVVAGTMQRHSNWMDLGLRAWDIPPPSREDLDIAEAHKLEEATARIPLSKERELLFTRLLTPPLIDWFRLTAGAAKAPSNPSVPKCLDCPEPVIKKPAYVVLRVTVGVDGRVIATKVLKASDPKTTEEVIQIVRKWRFQPATGPDGLPKESQTEVQVNFRPESR